MTVGLVRVGHQQVQVGGKDFPGRLAVIFQNLLQLPLDPLVLRLDLLGHLQRNGNLLILREVLAHIREGKKYRVLHQEPGVDQRGDAGQQTGGRMGLHRPPVGVVLPFLLLIDVLDHAVLSVKLRGRLVVLAVLFHQRWDNAVQQIEDAGAVTVDEGGGHANYLFRCAV